MRILYIFRSLIVWGGIERVLVDKMNCLTSVYGYEIHMLTTDQGNHPIPYPCGTGVHLVDLGIRFHRQYRYSGLRRLWDRWQRTRLFEKRLSEQINQICPDVIVCTTADPVYSITKVKGKIPLIVESHSTCSRTLDRKGLRKRLVANLLLKGLKLSACVVTLTDGDAVEWRKVHSHVYVIPNLVHLNQGEVASLENKSVIWVGRFVCQKCPLDIVRIWQKVFVRHPDWHLNIYGEGELQQELEDAVMALDMNIHIHQPTEHIFDAYRNNAILVSTSLFEPFGLVIPEAMSCGLPVVAYDCPYGPADIISDGVDGLLISNRNVNEFVEKVCQLIENEKLRREMGHAGIHSSQRYSASSVMPLWIQLFRDIIDG